VKKADNHWAEIKSGKVTYRIVGMPDRDLPEIPDHRAADVVGDRGVKVAATKDGVTITSDNPDLGEVASPRDSASRWSVVSRAINARSRSMSPPPNTSTKSFRGASLSTLKIRKSTRSQLRSCRHR